MRKYKAIFVTALVAVMLAAILVGLYMLRYRAYIVFVGLLGLYGFMCGALNFCHWLGSEVPLFPPDLREKPKHVELAESWPPDPEWADSYDKIKAETEAVKEIESKLGAGRSTTPS